MRVDPRLLSSGATLTLHAAAVVLLLQFDAVRRPLLEAAPLMVSLIAPPRNQPSAPAPEIVPPKPGPVIRLPAPVRAPEPPVLAAPSEAPGPGFVAPSPPPESAPVLVVPAPVAVVPAPPAPAPVKPPSFDAAYLRNPAPAYPLMSRRRGEQGKVVLRVHVLADGVADQVLLRTSSGHRRLDRAALDAVRQWRFVPARQGDQAVAAWVLVPIAFALEN